MPLVAGFQYFCQKLLPETIEKLKKLLAYIWKLCSIALKLRIISWNTLRYRVGLNHADWTISMRILLLLLIGMECTVLIRGRKYRLSYEWSVLLELHDTYI
jgi:hypothetical protein